VRTAATSKGCSALHKTVISDRTAEGGAFIKVLEGCSNVSGSFFTTLGIPLKRGRDFSDGDADNGGAAILDEKTARALFPHDDPIGRQIRLGGLQDGQVPWLRVVGIVGDKRLAFNPFPEMGPDSSMVVYVSTSAQNGTMGDIVFRPNSDAATAKLAVRRTLRALLPVRSNVQVQAMQQSYEDSLKVERFLSLMFALLGLAALLLGAAGLFSVISYIANHRLREFAVRIALGAPASSVIRLVMNDALTMALGGTAVGAGVGMYCGFMLWDKMWGVYPVDAGALIGAEAALIVVTMLACLAPALRASKADPLEIIRAS
jgi:ABC-type antimicrobial peptide transport system permease subunit